MGIAILNELQDRLHTLAIAGTNLLSEDFRLKKTAKQFHAIALSSPVLSKIDQMIQCLFDENNKEKEITLMDAITLVNAVVCTQANYTVKKEEQQQITVLEGGSITNIKYSELEPIITALTTKGSGRYEIIRNVYRNKKELFKDFRILPLLVKGLNDSYSELADLIERILIEIGENVVLFCKNDFDVMGSKDMIRRLNILEKLAKDSENDFYISLLENSSPSIREKAMILLGYSSQNIDLLIHLAETEKGKYKTAALTALSMLNEKKSIDYMIEKAKKKPQIYLIYLKNCNTKEASDIFAYELEKLLDELLQIDGKEVTDKVLKKLQNILPAIDYKYSDKLISVLERYGNENKIFNKVEAIRHFIPYSIQKNFYYKDDYHNRVYSTYDWEYNDYIQNHGTILNQILYFINYRLIHTILSSENENYIAMIKHLYKTCGKSYLAAMLVAEFLTEPEKTYDICAEYLNDESPITMLTIRKILGHIVYKGDGYYYIQNSNFAYTHSDAFYYNNVIFDYDNYCEYFYIQDSNACRFIAKEMDIRWIKSLTQLQNNMWRTKRRSDMGQNHNYLYEILEKWVNYNDTKTIPLFRSKFREFVKYRLQCFDVLQKLGETDFKMLVFEYAKPKILYTDYQAKIIELLKELPFTAKDRVEGAKMLLGTLESRITKIHITKSQYIDFKEELQQIIAEGKEV